VDTNPAREILVGTDGSATADEAVRRAASAARESGARLHIVTAVGGPTRDGGAEIPDEFRWMASPGQVGDEVLRRAADLVGPGLEVQLHSRPGDPADVLVELAAELGADLIVVGNKGMQGVGGHLRPSVPNRVSHHAPCDVLIVATTGRAA
jgi:nucleotide-binding universal stress UspA family protein